MTDSQLLRLLRSIDKHNQKVREIIEEIRKSGRKDCTSISERLDEGCLAIDCAESVGGYYLGSNWVNEGGRYVRRKKKS